jgi:hypothetical protein
MSTKKTLPYQGAGFVLRKEPGWQKTSGRSNAFLHYVAIVAEFKRYDIIPTEHETIHPVPLRQKCDLFTGILPPPFVPRPLLGNVSVHTLTTSWLAYVRGEREEAGR